MAALLVAIGLGTAMSLLDKGEVTLTPIVWAVSAMACWLTIVLIGCWLLIPRRSGRLFEQQRSLRHDFTVEWDDRGTTQQWPTGTVQTPWTDYNGWFESSAVVAFGLNDQLYHFIPKRVLDDKAAADLRRSARSIAE